MGNDTGIMSINYSGGSILQWARGVICYA